MVFLFTLFFSFCFANPLDFPSSAQIRTSFSRIEPTSLSQNLAFYELYPETKEGKLALKRAQNLLGNKEDPLCLLPISSKILDALVFSSQKPAPLSKKQLELAKHLSVSLENRSLKGSKATSEQELLSLEEDEIDIARSVLLLTHPHDLSLIETYEAYLDFMALQIKASLPKEASNEEKIAAINKLLFFDLHFSFPANSSWTEDIGHYTYLSSVMDKREGVCLGVSILYLSLAQRLNLPLTIITPPGHIFVSYQKEGKERNIETTSRGIHIPSKHYLKIETPSLQKRSKKEVMGLALMNEASTKLEKKDYKTAAFLYEKALTYIPHDPLIEKFLSYTYLLLREKEKAYPLLQKEKKTPLSLYSDHITEDFLANRVDEKGIEAIFTKTDETKESIEYKKNLLLETTQKYPLFREGLFQLASTYMQLHKEKKALTVLERLFRIDTKNPLVNYYLSSLYLERGSYLLAWKHFFLLQKLVEDKSYYPKALRDLQKRLSEVSFEPSPSFFK